MDTLEIIVNPKRRHTVVSLRGRLDLVAAQDAEIRLMEIADKPSAIVIIDLSDLEYVSSAGLRVLLLAAKSAQRNHGRVSLTGVKGVIEDTFRISGFLSIFETYDTVEDAEILLP